MNLTIFYYYRLKNSKMADSVINMEIKLFPEGVRARNVARKEIDLGQTTADKEAAYRQWIKKFPPERFDNGDIDARLIYHYDRLALANNYALEKNRVKAIESINMLEADFWKGNAYAGLSKSFYKTGELIKAQIYAKKAIESAFQYTDGKKGNSNAANSRHRVIRV